MRHALRLTAFIALCGLAPAAPAADPPRIEGLSNPQSQSIGRKACTDGPGPPVFVPMNDPCPGANLRSGSGGSGGAVRLPSIITPPYVDPREVERRRDARNQDMMSENVQARQRITEAWKHFKGDGVPVDLQRAFDLFSRACFTAVGGPACAMGAKLIIERPDIAWRRSDAPQATIRAYGYEDAYSMADIGCRHGRDSESCFMACAVTVDGGLNPPCNPEPAMRTQLESYRADLQAFRLKHGFGRPPLTGAMRPAPAPVAAAPLPAPVARPEARAPVAPAPQRSAAEWVAQHKAAPGPLPDMLLQALRREPDHAEANFLLGQLYARRMDPAEREKGYALMQKAVTLAPDQAAFHRGLGRELQEAPGRWTEAVAALQKATELEPANRENWSTLVTAHQALGRGAQALALLDAAVLRHPELAAVWAERGQLALRQNRPAVALVSFEKAVALDGNQMRARVELARMQCEAGRRKDALDNFETALERNGTNLWTLDLYNACRVRLKLPTVARYEGRSAARP